MPAPPGQLLRHGISDHQHRHGTAAVYISQKLIKPVEEFLQLRRLMRQPVSSSATTRCCCPGNPCLPHASMASWKSWYVPHRVTPPRIAVRVPLRISQGQGGFAGAIISLQCDQASVPQASSDFLQLPLV